MIPINSVVDVGCAQGEWLAEFKANGVRTTFGMDGPWVCENHLLVDRKCFKSIDLNNIGEPSSRYDLAISLEVAEHLTEESSVSLIKFLTGSARYVLFSAAIPGQGGTGHLNEQWPSYWVEIFEKFDFKVYDCLRKRIWGNESVAPAYRQNLFLFVSSQEAQTFEKMNPDIETHSMGALNVIHPDIYKHIVNWRMKPENMSISTLGKGIFRKALKKIR